MRCSPESLNSLEAAQRWQVVGAGLLQNHETGRTEGWQEGLPVSAREELERWIRGRWGESDGAGGRGCGLRTASVHGAQRRQQGDRRLWWGRGVLRWRISEGERNYRSIHRSLFAASFQPCAHTAGGSSGRGGSHRATGKGCFRSDSPDLGTGPTAHRCVPGQASALTHFQLPSPFSSSVLKQSRRNKMQFYTETDR